MKAVRRRANLKLNAAGEKRSCLKQADYHVKVAIILNISSAK